MHNTNIFICWRDKIPRQLKVRCVLTASYILAGAKGERKVMDRKETEKEWPGSESESLKPEGIKEKIGVPKGSLPLGTTLGLSSLRKFSPGISNQICISGSADSPGIMQMSKKVSRSQS